MRGEKSCSVAIEAGIATGPAIPMEPTQTDGLASVLSRAHYDAPQFRYMIPDERARLRLLPALFSIAIRACQVHGEVQTTHKAAGGALWIGPRAQLTIGHLMRTEFPSLRFQWEWASLRRCINVGLQLDKVHERLIRGPHWRLLALALEPTKPKENAGKLLEPVHSRADSDGLPCYVETFNESDLAFYKRHGFRIGGGGNIPRGGPDFWAMIRAPQAASLK